MKQTRKRLTYANVMSSIAVFLVLGGATAIAATELGKESVGTKELKKEAVSLAKIKKAAKNSLKGKAGPAGPAGAQGPAGPVGPIGPSNLYVGVNNGTNTIEPAEGRQTVVSVTLPPGKYLVTAKHTAQPSSGEPSFDCYITQNGTDVDTFYAGLVKPVSMMGTAGITVASTTTIISECRAFTNNVLIGLNTAKISALKVGAIN